MRTFKFGNRSYGHKTLAQVMVLLLVLFLESGCSAFVIRHTVDGKSQTYVTDTVFVGTGTFLDCVISPLHWAAGVFYKQPYIHVQGSNLSYPSLLFSSGCLASSYSHGSGILGFLGIGAFKENPEQAVFFTDTESKERALVGGSFEITRVTKRINFRRK